MGSKLDTRVSVDMSVVVFIVILLIRSVEDIPENGEISAPQIGSKSGTLL